MTALNFLPRENLAATDTSAIAFIIRIFQSNIFGEDCIEFVPQLTFAKSGLRLLLFLVLLGFIPRSLLYRCPLERSFPF